MNPPDPSVLPGRKLQGFAEKLLRWIESVKPVAGLGISIIETDSGRAINAAPRGGGGGTTGDKLTLYFIDGGVLKLADFSVSNVTTV